MMPDDLPTAEESTPESEEPKVEEPAQDPTPEAMTSEEAPPTEEEKDEQKPAEAESPSEGEALDSETEKSETEESETPEPSEMVSEPPEEEGEPEEDSTAELQPAEPGTEEVSEEEPESVETEEVGSESEEEEAIAEEAAAEEPASNKKWYVVKVQSGREDSIKEAIERRVMIDGLEDFFGQIYIPTEERTEKRGSRTYKRKQKLLPGYIMAEVEFNDEMLYLFRETSGVGDFVGGGLEQAPSPMSPKEVKQWLTPEIAGEIDDDEPDKALEDIPFSVGDSVKVKSGMFDGMEGDVVEIDPEKGMVSVQLTIFGRPVKTDLEHWNVEAVQ